MRSACLKEAKGEMAALENTLLRVALALPLAYGAYVLAPFPATDGSSLGVVLVKVALGGLPALGMVLGCVLLIARWTPWWAWSLVAASGLWIALLDVYVHVEVSDVDRLPDELIVIGAYTCLLALAFVVAGRRRVGTQAHG